MEEKMFSFSSDGRHEEEPGITKEAVIESLKKEPQNLGLFNKYIDMREKEVQQEGTGWAVLKLNIERADICIAAGLLDEAVNQLWDAAEQALNEGRDELCEELKNRARDIIKEG